MRNAGKNEANKEKQFQESENPFDLIRSTSAKECTGLIPTPPLDDEEYESYINVYDYGPQVAENPEETEIIK